MQDHIGGVQFDLCHPFGQSLSGLIRGITPYEPVVCKALAINDPAREDRGSEMTPYSPVRTSAEVHKYRIVTANLELRDRSS